MEIIIGKRVSTKNLTVPKVQVINGFKNWEAVSVIPATDMSSE